MHPIAIAMENVNNSRSGRLRELRTHYRIPVCR
jgi:hypothetical protein